MVEQAGTRIENQFFGGAQRCFVASVRGKTTGISGRRKVVIFFEGVFDMKITIGSDHGAVELKKFWRNSTPKLRTWARSAPTASIIPTLPKKFVRTLQAANPSAELSFAARVSAFPLRRTKSKEFVALFAATFIPPKCPANTTTPTFWQWADEFSASGLRAKSFVRG